MRKTTIATYTGEDTTQGKEVSWYLGGEKVTESQTTDASDNSNGYIALGAKAEWGSVILRKAGVVTGCVEYADASGNTIANDSTGTLSIKYTGLAASQAIEISYLDISTVTLTQVAMCRDVKSGIKADTKRDPVMGQATKLNTTGVLEQDLSFEAFYYNSTLIGAVLGDVVTDASGNIKFTTEYNSFKPIGAMVGKKYDTDLVTVLEKWFLYGVQLEGFDLDFKTDDKFVDSCKAMVDSYRKFIPA